jgi:hypothetical protein
MALSVPEETILQALRQVPLDRWQDVLDYLTSLQANAAGQTKVSPSLEPATISRLADSTWSAALLQQWPRAVQDAILRLQASRLINQHQHDPHFTEGVSWWNAREIGHLPVDQRDILLGASAIVAAEEYQTNPGLTAFDAFGEDDLYGDSVSSELFPGKPPTADAR